MVHITTPGDEFGPFSPILPVPVDVPTGWECPRCQRIYSPQTRQCVPCSPPPKPFTGPLPRPSTLGPLFPEPADSAAPRPEPRRREYTFGDFPIAVTDHPPRAPMCKCVLTPCEPPREGGLCGCDEPDDDPMCASCPLPRSEHADPASFRPRGPEKPNPLTITPPAHLIANPNGVRLVRLAGDWTEIFTGLQARFLDEGRIQAEVEFRLTPADGETGD